METELSATAIIRECCDAIIVKDIDYYNTYKSESVIWYSKHYGSGAFESAFRYHLENTNLTISSYLYGKGFGWRYGDTIIIDLSNPDSFKLISKHIREIFDNMQTDREKWK